jgi:hypothetical protein
MTKKKLLYVASHLSTGGMPQYILKQIQTFKDDFDIEVIEYNDHSGDAFVVQKNQIKELVTLHTLYEDKENNFLKLIKKISPNIIHFTEIPEHFISHNILDKVFSKKRKYDIVSSTHGSLTNPDKIKYHPDRYVLVSEWSRRKFEHLGVDTKVWEYPIEDIKYDKDSAKEELEFEKDWKHVLMVGLFSEGKNQSEIFQVARTLEKFKIKFHFVGNQAGNFKDYWEPIMKHKPKNCVVWGERNDTEKFYKASDLFYFSSKLELNPLSIKEALSYKLPCIFRRLETYLDTYDDNKLVTYINDDIYNTKKIILNTLKPDFNEIPGWFSYEEFYNSIVTHLPNNASVVEIGSWMGKSTNHFVSKVKEQNKKIRFSAIDTFKGSSGGWDDSLHKAILEPYDGDLYTEFSNNSVLMDNFNDITIIKDSSYNSKNLFLNNSQDFIMIDAGHEYTEVLSDIDSWFYKLKPGGIIAGDDFGTNLFQGLTRAVDEYFYGQVETREGWVWYRKRPRIQIKHMMTRPDDVREQISAKSLKQLQRWGFDYQPIINEVYDELPPKEFCRRPEDISDIATYSGHRGIGKITGRHYGCYLAHRNALETIDEENYDYTLIFEADAFIYSNLKDFVDIVHKACFISERDNVPYIGFGNNPSWNRTDIDEYFWQTDYNQDWAHAYLIPNRDKGWYMDRIQDCEWDVADLWYNHVFYHHKRPRYTTFYPYSKQAEGISLLDNTNKSWK